MRRWHVILLAGLMCVVVILWVSAASDIIRRKGRSEAVIPQRTAVPCTIDGILYSKLNPLVMVDKITYGIGNSVCGGTVTRIFREQVTMKFPEGEKVFIIGEAIQR